jgi:lysophospholipase L1-like esterase
MESFAAEEGIPVLNTYTAFREYRSEERLYHMQDMHWTAAGHRLMAQQLQHFLRDRLLCRKYMAETFQN